MPAAILFLSIAFITNSLDWNHPASYFNDMMSTTNVTVVFTAIILLSAMLILPLSHSFVENEHAQPAEYYAILLFSIVGAVMMVKFENMIMLFIGLEILSISMYVLTGSDKTNLRSNEAALKYFLMGSFATGILLFGVALLYGATGSFTLTGMAAYAGANAGNISPLLYMGISLTLVGVLFKLSAAPFHFWTPDVYDGAPTLFTAFMSTVVKTAGFAALYRLLSVAFTGVFEYWWYTMYFTTIITLIVGNITAVNQASFKRMLAYSSISHAGYLLIAVTAFDTSSQSSILFYSLAYSIATISAFGVLLLVSEDKATDTYDGFNGLARRNPFLAFVTAVAMCSLAGIPLTAGFLGKLFIFMSALQQGLVWLLVIAVIMSAVGIYYYFRVIIAMYLRPSTIEGEVPIEVPGLFKGILIITTILTILLGLAPSLFMSLL
jgi:NADH-quinone oxidoreductase subunit N